MLLKDLLHAVEVLKLHNEWRRDGNIDFTHPKAVGIAIDAALEAMQELIEIKTKQPLEPL